jgi:hypothetical protein
MGYSKSQRRISRAAEQGVQPVNGGKTSMSGAKAAMHSGSGKIGSLSDLTRKTHKGSGSKGTLRSLVSGTKKTGKSPFPSMGRGPLR